jgi:glycerate 2-kinase
LPGARPAIAWFDASGQSALWYGAGLMKANGQLEQLWRAGVESVCGRRAVARALSDDGDFAANLVIAVGKAACSMFLGARDCIANSTRCIIVTKYQHVDPACRQFPNTEIIEAGHPVPDNNSLLAGKQVFRAVTEASTASRLLLLVSGGSSALAEHLLPGHDLHELRELTNRWLASGQSIAEINRLRGQVSSIKSGKLLSHFRGSEMRVYAISDVQGDSLGVIGGGIGDPARAAGNVGAGVIATNAVARKAVAAEAGKLGLTVRFNEESLYQDVPVLAEAIAEQLTSGLPGVYIFGGEPTIKLPEKPGTGGRNQSLALAIACRIRGQSGISVLVAGTDGSDGPTEYAGAFVDGRTVGESAEDRAAAEVALEQADAGTFLQSRDCLYRSGPTDTNVMDLVVATVN